MFAEFRKTQFSLLWRASRDGFESLEFDCRCDGHANTLTVILDTNENIFGGVTPVKWESQDCHFNADDNLKSFLFRLENPHNIPARKFAVNAENKDPAIEWHSGCRPRFGKGSPAVCDECNVDNHSHTQLGDSDTNDIGLVPEKAFKGLEYFKVKEIDLRDHKHSSIFTQSFECLGIPKARKSNC
jgi:hypothetical protein